MLLEKRRTLPQRILRQIRIETHQSECRVIDQSQRRKTDQSGDCNKAGWKNASSLLLATARARCVFVHVAVSVRLPSPRAVRRNAYIYRVSLCDEVGGLFPLSGILVLTFARWRLSYPDRKLLIFVVWVVSKCLDVGKSARVLAVTAVDVVNALKRQGRTLYGFGG